VLATSRGGSAATAQPPRMAGLVGTVARAPSVVDATVRCRLHYFCAYCEWAGTASDLGNNPRVWGLV